MSLPYSYPPTYPPPTHPSTKLKKQALSLICFLPLQPKIFTKYDTAGPDVRKNIRFFVKITKFVAITLAKKVAKDVKNRQIWSHYVLIHRPLFHLLEKNIVVIICQAAHQRRFSLRQKTCHKGSAMTVHFVQQPLS